MFKAFLLKTSTRNLCFQTLLDLENLREKQNLQNFCLSSDQKDFSSSETIKLKIPINFRREIDVKSSHDKQRLMD